MQRTENNTFRRVVTWLLVLLMVISLIPTPQAKAVSGTTVAADGTYTASGTVDFSKDKYTFNVVLTVSGGKITNITSELTSTPEESKSKSKYHPNAVAAILKNLKSKDATYSNIDGVSSGTPKYSYAALKKALLTAISNAPAAAAAQTYTVTWKSQDGNTTLETDTKVTAGTQPSYDGTTPTKANTSTTIYNFAGWATKTGQTSGTAANKLPAVTANVTYYAAFSETKVQTGSYNVTWRNWDGTEIKTTSVTSGQKPIFGDADPVKPGDTENEYTFAGWATSQGASSGTPEGSLPAVTGAVTYYAAFAQPAGVEARTISIANGTYVNSSADVTTRDYTYNPVTTIVVSGGKITSITSEMLSDNAINQLRHKRATQEVSSALVGQKVDNVDTLLQLLSDLNPDSSSSKSLADAVSGATLSTYALLNEIKVALCGTLVNPSASAKTKNPTAVTSNGITLEKTLTYNGDGSYDVNLKAYAMQGEGTTQSGSTYWETNTAPAQKMWQLPTNDSARTANTLTTKVNGEYVYFYKSGNYAYPLFLDNGTVSYQTDANTVKTIKEKNLSSETNIYTTIEQAGTQGTTTYTKEGYQVKYSYAQLQSGDYYYLYNGTYYQLSALSYKDSSKDTRYVAYFMIGSTKYYLDKTPQAYTDKELKNAKAGEKKEEEAYKSCKSDKESEGKNLPLYTKQTTAGTTPVTAQLSIVTFTMVSTGDTFIPVGKTKLGADAVLMDVVNLISWDASRAEISATTKSITMNANGVVTEGSETANSLSTSAMSEDGVIEVTGFDYRNTAVSKGGSGEELVLTIRGIRPTRAGDYVASNALDVYGQNAGVFDGTTQVVDIVSPLAKVLETDVAEVYTPTESGSVTDTTNFYGTVTVEEGSTMNFSNCTFYEHVYVDGVATFTNCTFRAGMTTTGSSTVTNCNVYMNGSGSYNYSYASGNENFFFNSLLNDKDGKTAISGTVFHGVGSATYTVSTNSLGNWTSGVQSSFDFNPVAYADTGKDVYISAEPKVLVPDGISAATNRAGSGLTVKGEPNTVGERSFTLKLGSEDQNDTVIYYIPVNMSIGDRDATPVDDTNNNQIRKVTKDTVSEKDSGLHLDKTLTEDANGLYNLTLEAYTTGAVFSETYTAPADIVLVLDQSSSMSKSMTGSSSRLAALKSSVTTFISEIQKNAAKNDLDHKIAIVGFASDYNTSYKNYPNTELLIGNEQINYEDATKANYASALLDVNVNGAVNSQLTTAVNNVTASGQTYANFGMMMAKNVLQNRTETTFMKDGKQMPRRTVVIFFTDGCPGNPAYTFFSEDYDSISVANETILRSAELTAIGATIYTVGIFDGAGSTADYTFQYGTDYSFYNAGYGSSWIFEHAYYPGENAANAFLHYISSDYPNARSMEDGGVPAPEMYSADGAYTGYYYSASNMTALTQAFTNISVEVTRPILDLKDTAVLFDELTDNFEITDATKAGITATVHPVSGYDSQKKAYTFYNQSSQTLTADLNGKVVTVTGFDYDSNYLYKDANGTYHGSKLVVTIPALVPKTSGVQQDSNTGRSGIYADPSDISANRDAVGYFPKPNTDIPYYTRIVDLGVKGAVVATNVKQLKGANANGEYQGQYGVFKLVNDTVTYTLNKAMPAAGGSVDLTVGIDTAFVYGQHGTTAAEELNYKIAEPKWQQITVVPGTNVYFDDSYADMGKNFKQGDETDISYAYTNADINAASMNGEDETLEKGVYTITFTGTGIDVYSTTDSNSGYVQAALYDKEGTRLAIKTMKNYSVTERYNTPSIFFNGYDYDTYTLKINVLGSSNYRFDAIRVYNPVSESTTYTEANLTKSVADLYKANGEQNAKYVSLRELVLNSETVKQLVNDAQNVTAAQGIAFYIDQEADGKYEISNDSFLMDGPKNEIYLKPGQSIAFATNGTYEKIEVGISSPDAKVVNGKTVATAGKVTVTNGAGTKDIENITVVDTYYAITPTTAGNIVITNTGDSTISLTKVKLSGAYTAPTTLNTDSVGAVINPDDAPLLVTASLRSYAKSFASLPMTVEEPEPSTIPDSPAEPEEPAEPTAEPTTEPTVEPTAEPSEEPTPEPTVEPTAEPTPTPTPTPSSSGKNIVSTVTQVLRQVSTVVQSVLRTVSRLFGRW